MQVKILKNKNSITLLTLVFIVLAFFCKWAMGNDFLYTAALVIASLLGVTPIVIQAYQSLRVKVISIDLLVSIAVIGAFLIQNFEESAIVTFLFLFGGYLEQRTLSKTRRAIKELTEMAPESALKQMQNGDFSQVDIDEVAEGDVLLIRTGAKVPVDGMVLEGEGYINEASITGESVSLRKGPGEKVFAGTILENGSMRVSAERVGEDSTFGRIIELVEEAQDSKSAAERFIDRFAKYYTPAVLILALVVWLLTGDFELSITVLVLGCPGALVIGVPVSNVAGIGNGARHGILFKGSEVMIHLSKVDSMLFDKTGTLTVGQPSVLETLHYSDNQVAALRYLASVERESDHPLAKAVLHEIGDTAFLTPERLQTIKGLGLTAYLQGRRVAVGNTSLMEKEQVMLSAKAKSDIERLSREGNSIVLMSVDGELKILMGIRDRIRPDLKKTLKKLEELGIKKRMMLSGDNQRTVDAVSRELDLSQAFGAMLPAHKMEQVKTLKEEGRVVAFVGDGVNDSPSLALADVGIAMGGGTDVAIETSDLVLMNSDFSRLPHAVGLAKATANNMKQNIVMALGVVLLLFAGLFLGSWVNMSIGMLVHEASILLVILNGMRLTRYRLK